MSRNFKWRKILTLKKAQALIDVFVYQMPFNQLIGLELIRLNKIMLRSNFATKTNWLAISHNAFYMVA